MTLYPPRWPIDFHVHTRFSKDCRLSPRGVLEIARRRGLRGVAVTDHDTEEGGLATRESNRDAEFLVIPGAEIRTELGDVIGLFLHHPIRTRRFAGVLEEIRSQGGFAIVPHPLRTFGADRFATAWRQRPGVDAWELWNGRYSDAAAAKASEIFADLEIRNAVSGSDAHLSWEIGRCRTLLEERPDTSEALRRGLQSALQVRFARADWLTSLGVQLATLTKLARTDRPGACAAHLVALPFRAARYAGRKLSV